MDFYVRFVSPLTDLVILEPIQWFCCFYTCITSRKFICGNPV